MALAQMQHDDEAWSDEQFNANARKVVRTLMFARGLEAEELAKEAEITVSTFYTRINDTKPTRFTGPEIRRLARALKVRPTVFFEDAETLLDPSAIVRWFTETPLLTSVNNPSDDQLSFDYDPPAPPVLRVVQRTVTVTAPPQRALTLVPT